MGLRRNVRGILYGVALPHQRRRPGGERLGRPGLFADQIRFRNRPLLDRPERFARDAVEHEEQPVFAPLRDRIDLPATVVHSQENRRTGQVFVQQIVMHDLKMPDPFSSRGVQREDAVRE